MLFRIFCTLFLVLNIWGTVYASHYNNVQKNDLPANSTASISKQSAFGKLISAFSVPDNCKMIFTTTIGKNSIKSFYGIR